ncbi:MAG TPA: IclR family transcriptional regulator [Usitatibacter sp.]|nr:IclR family transcriptional regulator [Usitatibacter sp.]
MKTADRTLRVFEGFSELGRPATLSELARYLSIPVSSCYGLLRALEERGYVYAVEPRSTYFPTARLMQVARRIADSDPLGAKVAPALRKLRDETGETVVLAKRRDTEVVFLDVLESPSTIRYVARVGETRELHATSLGRALLSLVPAGERAALLRRLAYRRLTARTAASQKAVEAAIAAGEARGAFLNFGESVPDLYAIACPVVVDGKPYAVAVIGPGKRIEDNQKRLVSALQKACRSIADPAAKLTRTGGGQT